VVPDLGACKAAAPEDLNGIQLSRWLVTSTRRHGVLLLLLLLSHRVPPPNDTHLQDDGLNYLGNPGLIHAQSILATLAVQVCVQGVRQIYFQWKEGGLGVGYW
jgi:hypothetical protein